MRIVRMLAGAGLAAGICGCAGTNMLDKRYVSVRPEYGDKSLPNAGVEAPKHLEMVNESPTRMQPPDMQDVVTGTWTFTTPPTTTRVERKEGGFSQYSLYSGKPAPGDTPIVVISVGTDAGSIAESDPATYTVKNSRSYILNGNPTKEWTGTTKRGDSFSELVISKLGSTVGTEPGSSVTSKSASKGASKDGDVCHVMAVAKTAEERKVALEILKSITWTGNGASQEGAPARTGSGADSGRDPGADAGPNAE